MREQAQADVEASRAQAIADLRAEVATLAIGAAEQVVGAEPRATRPTSPWSSSYIDSVGAEGSN